MVPSMTRSNHRHRGPVETTKANDHRLASHQDMLFIMATIEEQSEEIRGIVDSLRSGYVFSVPQTIYTKDQVDGDVIDGLMSLGQFTSSLSSLQSQLNLKGGHLNG